MDYDTIIMIIDDDHLLTTLIFNNCWLFTRLPYSTPLTNEYICMSAHAYWYICMSAHTHIFVRVRILIYLLWSAAVHEGPRASMVRPKLKPLLYYSSILRCRGEGVGEGGLHSRVGRYFNFVTKFSMIAVFARLATDRLGPRRQSMNPITV